MDTPRQAPREIKSTILRVAKLTIGAAALATIAAVVAKRMRNRSFLYPVK